MMKKIVFLLVSFFMITAANAQNNIFGILYTYNFICQKNSSAPFIVNFTANKNHTPIMTRKFVGYSETVTYTLTHQLGWKDLMFADKSREILLTFSTFYDNQMKEFISNSFSLKEVGPGINYFATCEMM